MSIVKMKKISLYGLNSEKDVLLRDLAFAGCVEIRDQSEKLQSEEWVGLVSPDTADLSLNRLEDKMSGVKSAIDVLTPLASKRKAFAPKPKKTVKDFERVLSEEASLLVISDAINEIVKRQDSLLTENSKAEVYISSLKPWEKLDIPMSLTGTKFTSLTIGTIPVRVEIDELKAKLNERDIEAHISVINSSKTTHYITVLYYKSCEDEVMDFLKDYSFNKVNLKRENHTISEEIKSYNKKIEKNIKELADIKKELTEFVENLGELEFLYDAYRAKHNIISIKSSLVKTNEVFLAEGYVPEKNTEKVDSIIEGYTAYVEYADPDDYEDTPVLLKNNGIITPYEMVTELYSLPKYGSIDPNSIMAPFFWLFFGIMMADIGYGLVMLGLGLFVLLKFKPTGFAGKLFGLVTQCGISTILIGIVYGSFFGDSIPIISELFTGKSVNIKSFIDPIKDPITVMLACIGLGFIHIIVGMGIEAYQLIKDGKPFDALFDIGFWYIVFAGIIAFLIIGKPGLYISAAGAIGLVLTQGRSKKGIFGKLSSGILSLYGITGYLSDLLSYSRLLALGLSSAVIASVLNTMGALGGRSIFGIVLFIVVFIAGHLFNLALGVLGAYVHSSRLQYVEFFGKFYRSGGIPFKPFKMKSKYVEFCETDNK